MTVGDGSNWDESNPTNSTLAISIDDYDRDLRVGIRSRMTIEHEWPSSQSATNQAGQHKFITLQNQAAKPTVSGTQIAAVYTKTVGAGLQEAFFEDEAGNEIQLTSGTGLGSGTLQISSTYVTTSTILGGVAFVTGATPQTGSGNLVCSLAVTPKSTGSKLKIDCFGAFGETGNTANVIIGALFQATTANAIAAQPVSIGNWAYGAPPIGFSKVIASPGTTAVTFYFKVGGDSAVGLAANFNSVHSAVVGTGGACGMVIEEIL